MPEENSHPPAGFALFWRDLAGLWRSLPLRVPVLVLVGLWVVMFQFLGNSTLGYINTPSLFGWWLWTAGVGALDASRGIRWSALLAQDEVHVFIMPFVVAVLLWCRRREIVSMPKKLWWPALGLLVAALMLHLLGYMIQQTRISLAGFFLGVFALTGLFWGTVWLRLALFPFGLLLFCVPLGAGGVEIITFPLRLLATRITGAVCHGALGINVIQEGTLLFDAAHSYEYEVAAACSGIRSLTAILAFSVIYAFLTFKSTWRRLVVVGAAFPLAVVANVFRLTLIIVAAEAFGRNAGNYVHASSLFSLAPYVPSIGGVMLLGWWLREDRPAPKSNEPLLVTGARQEL